MSTDGERASDSQQRMLSVETIDGRRYVEFDAYNRFLSEGLSANLGSFVVEMTRTLFDRPAMREDPFREYLLLKALDTFAQLQVTISLESAQAEGGDVVATEDVTIRVSLGQDAD